MKDERRPAQRADERAPARWVPAGQAASPDAAGLVLRVASLLLDHPSTLEEDPADLIRALALSPAAPGAGELLDFLGWWSVLAAGERERRYEETFDQEPRVTLFLEEGRPGMSRHRAERRAEPGPAAEGAGSVRRDELPDYLPLLLQVAARVPAARPALAAERPALEGLAAALEQRASPFAAVVAAVLAVLPEA